MPQCQKALEALPMISTMVWGSQRIHSKHIGIAEENLTASSVVRNIAALSHFNWLCLKPSRLVFAKMLANMKPITLNLQL